METALLLAQTVSTAALAGWLSLGVRDNLLHPELNETYTAEVLEMTRMRAAYPKEYAMVAHRAVTDRKLQKLAFRAVVSLEIIAVILLWIGAVFLMFATLGAVAPDSARAFALLGATAFVSIWASMLVVGNHFSYWFCHEGAQNTHYQMTLWGLGTLILLAQG